MIKNSLTEVWRVARGILCGIGILWCIVQISSSENRNYESQNYKVYYLPRINSYVCVRLVDADYHVNERGDLKYIDLTFGDSPESVINLHPWNADMIRYDAYRLMYTSIYTMGPDRDTVYVECVNNHCQFINRKKNQTFIEIERYPGDFDFIDFENMLDAAEISPYRYIIRVGETLKIKNINIYSKNEGEEIQEIPAKSLR